LGDLIGAFLVGIIGVVFLSLVMALMAPVPAPTPGAIPDVRLTVSESFLNRFVRTSIADEAVQVDILPGGQFSFVVDTSVAALGLSIPVHLTGLFDVQPSGGQMLEVRLLETQMADMVLPPELNDFFAGSLANVNNELNIAVNNMSTALGAPLNFTGVGSTESTFWLEAEVLP
jgi:hypothetical protein